MDAQEIEFQDVMIRLVERNPGLENMRMAEFCCILRAFIEDIEAGRQPIEPFNGLLALVEGADHKGEL